MDSELNISLSSDDYLKKLSKFPENTKEAVDYFINILTKYVHPIYIHLEKDLEKEDYVGTLNNQTENKTMLCFTLLSKYIKLMKEVFNQEIKNSVLLQESRNWVLGRICWVLKLTNQLKNSPEVDIAPAFTNYDGDEFVLWIDKALELLENIKNCFENDSEKDDLNIDNSLWKIQCTKDLLNLHLFIKDTVSGAMKICQSCLSSDQNIIIARCHVTFREWRKFLGEMTTKDNVTIDNFAIKVEDVKPKGDLHYPTIRLLSDVLKDAIYNLEASVNRAVLGLVIHCLGNPLHTVNSILEQTKHKDKPAASEIDTLLENFDSHLERVVQVGLFSISCSADKTRIFALKRCLLSMEDLEVQLIPSLLSNARNIHTDILTKQWAKEMSNLKQIVFLIVDPSALIDLVMEKFRSCLIKVKEQSDLNLEDVLYLINLGRCVYDYIHIYKDHEPTTLPNYTKIFSFLEDLQKVLTECLTVCQLFLMPNSEANRSLYNNNIINKQTDKDVKQNQNRIVKRLKLLYSVLSNISQQIIEESICDEDHDEVVADENSKAGETYTHKGAIGILDKFKNNNPKDVIDNCKVTGDETKVLCNVNNKTFSSRSTIVRLNATRNSSSVFAKTNPLLSSKFYKKHKGPCMCNSASFFSSDCTHQDFLLANISEEDMKVSRKILMESLIQEHSSKSNSERMNFRRNQRKSLRKTLLMNKVKSNECDFKEKDASNTEIFDATQDLFLDNSDEFSTDSDGNSTDWHITEILEQLTQLSNTLSVMNNDIDRQLNSIQEKQTDDHVVKLKINDHPFSSPKNQWNIKITNGDSSIDHCNNVEDTNKTNNSLAVSKVEIVNITERDQTKNNSTINCGIDVSYGSDVPTPERLRDINQLEEKLTTLKKFWK